MADEKECIRVIARLNELTQERDLAWKRTTDDSFDLGRDKRVHVAFETAYKDQRLRLYEEEYMDWYEEERFSWRSKVVLAFIDFNGQNVWEFPVLPGLWDLLESVRYQDARVDEFFDYILTKGDSD